LIHIVKPHQPQSAYLKQIAKTFRRNQSGACTAALNYRVCRNGSAMYQLLDIAAGDAGFLKHVLDTGEDRLGVIAARRQDLPGDKGAVAGEEDEVGKSAADIDTEATRKISIHSFLISTAGFADAPKAPDALDPYRKAASAAVGLSQADRENLPS